jgi:phosphate/sulfate permease
MLPTLFVGTTLGSGIEKIINENEIAPSFFDILTSKHVYYPILGFFIILIIALIVRKKNYQNKI